MLGGLVPSSKDGVDHKAIGRAHRDPAWFSALKGCGPVAEFEEAIDPHRGRNHVPAVCNGTTARHDFYPWRPPNFQASSREWGSIVG